MSWKNIPENILPLPVSVHLASAEQWKHLPGPSHADSSRNIVGDMRVGFTSDGSYVLSIDENGYTQAWTTVSGEPVRPSVSMEIGTTPSWRASKAHTKMQEIVDTNPGVLCIDLSPDETHILTGDDQGDLCFWSAETGSLLQIITEETTGAGMISSVAFSPNSDMIASGSIDHRVRIWPVLHGTAEDTPLILEGHMSEVECVAFSPDGTHLVSGARDGAIHVWNAHNGSLALPPFYHPSFSNDGLGWLTSVAFSPDGERVVSGSREQTLCIWDLQGEERVFRECECRIWDNVVD